MGSGSGPDQVEDGIGGFLSGGRDVDGEAKEARVIAPVQQYLKIVHLGGSFVETHRALWWEESVEIVRKRRRGRISTKCMLFYSCTASLWKGLLSMLVELELVIIFNIVSTFILEPRAYPPLWRLDANLPNIYNLTPGTVSMMN